MHANIYNDISAIRNVAAPRILFILNLNCSLGMPCMPLIPPVHTRFLLKLRVLCPINTDKRLL